MNNITVNLTDASDRKYLLFQCAPSSETRGRRPTHDNGCKMWGVRMTTVPTFDIQTQCKWCGNRGRKHADHFDAADVFSKRTDAEVEMYRRNYYPSAEVIE